MEENERRPFTSPFVGDPESADLNKPHRLTPYNAPHHPRRVVSPVMWKKRSGAFFRLVKCTTSRQPWQAAPGGTRHGQGYQGRWRAQALEPVSLSGLIHQQVRIAIETAVHEELRAALGTTPHERSDVRRGYRNGTKVRTLTGPTGPVALTLPRATL